MIAWTLLPLVLVAINVTGTAQGVDSRSVSPPLSTQEGLEQRIDAWVDAAISEHHLPGLSLTIGVGPEVYLSRGWGATSSAGGEAADADSLYRAGSWTLQLASVAALQLVDAGRLDLGADVVALLIEPRSAETDEAQDEKQEEGAEGEPEPEPFGVTLEHLLSQTSGLPDYTEPEHFGAEDAGVDFERILDWLAVHPREFDAGTCFAYSATNTLLLGRIVEHASGLTLAELCASSHFEPLELESTMYCTNGPAIRTSADATQEIRGDLEQIRAIPLPFEAEALCTSSKDLFTWTRALLDGPLLDRTVAEDMFAFRVLPSGETTGFGLGFNVGKLDREECISFGGGMAGSRLHVAYYPTLDLIITILCGREDAPVDRIERGVARLFFRMPEPQLRDISLSEEEMARYVGSYLEGCTRLDIRRSGDHLILVSPFDGDEPFRLLYQDYHVFVTEQDTEFRLTFEVEQGDAVALVIEANGMERHAVRAE